ncbi:MAG: hypothetical protein HFG15_00255 [Bacilli bacterium]|jgi:hypothetical protein|nr:hypothetical protein [Bacilli bacterium]
MNGVQYGLTKTGHSGCDAYINFRKLKGFKVTPKNKIRYNGVQVKEMVIFNVTFVKKVLERKTRIKLESYLQYIMRILEMIDTTGGDDGTINIALNDLDRYKRTIMNKYRVYLDKRYTELLLKKIALYERELRMKQAYLMAYPEEIEYEKEERSR